MNKFIFVYLVVIATVKAYPSIRGHNGGLVGTGQTSVGSEDKANLGIVNGVKSDRMKPFLCSLREFGEHICGCSILNSTTILTAAHCLQKNYPADVYRIGVGNKQISGQILYDVIKYVNHENYDQGFDYNYDVAIIKLEKPIEMKPGSISKIKLNSDCSSELPYGELATVAGWGVQSEELEEAVNDLFETKVKVLKNTDPGCKVYFEEGKISPTMVCAGHADGKTDSCQGDSGGVLWNKFNEQIGIVSWGRGCSRANVTGVYTNICTVLPWIEKNKN